jgi:hypothetical protein
VGETHPRVNKKWAATFKQKPRPSRAGFFVPSAQRPLPAIRPAKDSFPAALLRFPLCGFGQVSLFDQLQVLFTTLSTLNADANTSHLHQRVAFHVDSALNRAARFRAGKNERAHCAISQNPDANSLLAKWLMNG